MNYNVNILIFRVADLHSTVESRPMVENAGLTGKISKYTYLAPLPPPQGRDYKQTSSFSAPTDLDMWVLETD